ncbi:hypothetical protein W97_06328 [Coniosporium apollinis CBS 100218]|uniref:Uncharacterized protein n=1 Tax=Coniosporium apollinis (strain CBS 100218) TaxID=1168221 RepID=R7YYQ8_CONA1|nr:uncharacterized protein W97_06328 [Coniosporium apollinis CBS 100218]EON66924.1 hypothetical protein W97_06328 [Coniosporium apollinis CBS 100218]
MRFIRFRCAPEDCKAVIAVTIRTSSFTLSLSAPEDPASPFQLVIGLRITSSMQPGRPITICTGNSVFERSPPPSGGLDMLAQGAVGGGLINTHNNKRIGLGLFRLHHGVYPSDSSPDLKIRGKEFITIPGDGSESRVTHDLPFSRMFKYAEGIKKEDLQPGETYKVGIYHGCVGTTWWCWGALDGDLKGKRLCAWQEGFEYNDVARPSDEEVEREGWVLGMHPAQLKFEDQTEGGYAELRIVE